MASGNSVTAQRQTNVLVLTLDRSDARNALDPATAREQVQAGGVGHWGSNPVPGAGARVQVSSEEAKTLVNWVLSLK